MQDTQKWERRLAYMKNWRKNNASKVSQEVRELNRRKRIAWQYGISVEAYEQIIAQGCAAKGLSTVECNGELGIDHNHHCCAGRRSCGKCVRQALCLTHNLAEGHYDAAIGWVERYRLKHK